MPATNGTVYFDGARYRRARRSRNTSQAVVATRSGYSPAYVAAVETGYRDPTLEGAVALCDAIDIPIDIVLVREPVS
jgi:transcriptional regulator with XRE-family HTH domain